MTDDKTIKKWEFNLGIFYDIITPLAKDLKSNEEEIPNYKDNLENFIKPNFKRNLIYKVKHTVRIITSHND